MFRRVLTLAFLLAFTPACYRHEIRTGATPIDMPREARKWYLIGLIPLSGSPIAEECQAGVATATDQHDALGVIIAILTGGIVSSTVTTYQCAGR